MAAAAARHGSGDCSWCNHSMIEIVMLVRKVGMCCCGEVGVVVMWKVSMWCGRCVHASRIKLLETQVRLLEYICKIMRKIMQKNAKNASGARLSVPVFRPGGRCGS